MGFNCPAAVLLSLLRQYTAAYVSDNAAVNDALCFDIASLNLQLFVILFKAALQLGLANLAVVLQQFVLLSLLIVLAH